MQIYLLIADDRQGPFTPEQITEKIKAGECTSETLAWKEGQDGWQALRQVCPLTGVPPTLPEPQSANAAPKANWGRAVLSFLNGYRGLFRRIKSSPLPDPLQWYDSFTVILPAAFVAFFFGGFGLIPLLQTSRLSGGDKGRLAILAAWPIWMTLFPVFLYLLAIMLFLLPIVGLVMMWVKKWFSPNIRYAVTGIVGLLVCFGIFSESEARAAANEKFAAEKPAILEKTKAALEAENSTVLAQILDDYELVSDADFAPLREQARQIVSQATTDQAVLSQQLSELREIGSDVWGKDRFQLELLDSFGNNSDTLGKEVRITINESNPTASRFCRQIVLFFEEASQKWAVSGFDYFRFKCYTPVVWDDGRKENAQLIRFGLTASEVASIQWENMSGELLLSRIRRGAVSEFWQNPSFEWSDSD